jgi:tRNA pseudouridine55 synthase
MYSALKREGRPLYAYARQGRTLDRPARPVIVHALDLVRLEGARLELRVVCSKGTYIRVLAQDIGEALGCGAHLSRLIRERTGPFSLEHAHTLDQFEAMTAEERDRLLLPVDVLLGHCVPVRLGPVDAQRFGHGQPVSIEGEFCSGLVRVYGAEREFLGTAYADGCGRFHPKRLVRPGEPPQDASQGGASRAECSVE